MPKKLSRASAVPRPDKSPGAATIRQVAAHAGVSVATVSRVFNRNGPVRDETSRRVLESAGLLRYVPNAAARSLSIRRSNTVGVLLPDLYGEFFSEVIRGIDTAARARHHHLLVSGFHSDHLEMAAMLTSVRGRVDGLVVMSPDADAVTLCESLPTDIPCLLLNCHAEGYPSIAIDNHGGAGSMVRHLHALGHRSIAFVSGPENNADASERLRGFRDASTALGLSPAGLIELPGDFTEQAGRDAVLALGSKQLRPSAIFAANDAMAIGAMSALRDLELRVPHDVVVVGFDDIPVARYITPPLTTVAVEIADLGRLALELLLDAIDGMPPESKTLPTTLVVRESCGATGIPRVQEQTTN
jgi:LacI family transcriptional regulator